MDSLDAKRRGRAIAGVAGFLVAVAYLVQATTLPVGTLRDPGAAVFPLAVGAGFVVVSVLTVVEAWRAPGEDGELQLPKGRDLRRLLSLLGALVGYAVVLPVLGHLVASVLFAVVAIRVLSSVSLLRVALYGTALGVGIFSFFVAFLGVPMPGPFGR